MNEEKYRATKRAKLNLFLKELLEYRFLYVKKDGTKRWLRGTLNSESIPDKDRVFVKSKSDKPENETILKVYDMDAMGWRTVIVDNVIMDDISVIQSIKEELALA